ncbi:MAG: S53 family peptidase [Thermoplasmata archaeon]|nr:S53 family peptidase [Thermoplasmata archaeon]
MGGAALRGSLFAAALVALLLLPSLGTAGPAASTGASASSASIRPAVPTLPAIFQLPWAERAGYDAAHASEVSAVAPLTGNVTVTLTLRPSDPALFQPLRSGARPLTPVQLGERYGLPAADYSTLLSYLAGEGLSVRHTFSDRLSLTVDGPAARVDAAFQTTLESGSYMGRVVHFPLSAPRLPPLLENSVTAISGLSGGFSTFTMPFSAAPLPSAGRASASPSFVYPTQLHSIYDFDRLYNLSGTPHFATGVGIALVLWGDGYAPGDLNTFFSNDYPSAFPSVSWAGYPVDGAPVPSQMALSDPSHAPRELTLDMEWAGSAAPGATLNAVYAPDGLAANGYSPSDTGLEDALNTAITIPGVQVVSMSFGATDGGDAAFQAAYTTSFAKAISIGITVLAASGDNGGLTRGASCTGGTDPQFPASSPDVLAVGGTAPVFSTNALGQVTGLQNEPAWNGSGGGYSSAYASPKWQTVGSAATPIAQNGGARGLPDVAGPAAYDFFYYDGGPSAGMGTSFATPMWAGLIGELDAVRNSSLGLVTPRLYQIGAKESNQTTAAALVDVTDGANCLGNAQVGWDTATGWGSPRAYLLYRDLSSTFVTLTILSSPSSVVPAGTYTTTLQVTNATSHLPIPNLPVTLTLSSQGYTGPCSGVLGTAAQNTDTNGTVALSVSLPDCYFGSSAGVDALVAAGGYYGEASTSVAVNLLGVSGVLAILKVWPYNLVAFALIMTVVIGIGWKVGNWRRRRDVSRRRTAGPPPSEQHPDGTGPPRSPAPPPAANPPAPSDGPAGPPSAVIPASPPRVVASTSSPDSAAGPVRPMETPTEGPVAAPNAIPAHVLDPPRSAPLSPPPPAPSTAPSAVPCLDCGFPLSASARKCPLCGSNVPEAAG